MKNRLVFEFDFDGPTGLDLFGRTVEKVLIIDLSGPAHLFAAPAFLQGWFDTEPLDAFWEACEDEIGYLEFIEDEDQFIVIWSDEVAETDADELAARWIKQLTALGVTCSAPVWQTVVDYTA